jgi:hypothetical protein
MKLKNRRLVWAGCLIFLWSDATSGAVIPQYTQVTAISPAQKDQLVIDEPFLTARARVIRSGWKPARLRAKSGHSYDGAEKKLVDRKIFEVDACSMDAGANCIFYYRKKQHCLRIDTIGEQVQDMKVARWTQECPVD